jgi:two-component system response regulator GlrR
VVLRVMNRPAQPRELHLLEGSCVLGAGKGVDVVIDDETVSRRHVELSLVAEGVAVQDLASHNGTYYLKQRIERAVLAIGSTIHLGRAEIRIEPDRESLMIGGMTGGMTDVDRYGDLIGRSLAMRKVFALLSRLESSLANILVQGDSGTGKELVARAIHDHSPVSAGPFLAVNCGAMDRGFVRSELFGHKRGAFTGAVDNHIGVFEAASGGTLFLDEVGELPLDVQPVLLRTLEIGTITRMGENTERPVKVRIVAATHRDLRGEVEAGRFREDLYFRLMVVNIQVPPLRERPEDVTVLAQYFASEAGLSELPAEIVTELATRSLPGNVRELKNALQTYAALGILPARRSSRDAELDDRVLRTIDLQRPYAEQKDQLLKRFMRVYLEALLSHTGGNQSTAARVSGLQRSYINKVVQQLRTGDDLPAVDDPEDQ